jgi:hypothetical protein
MQEQTSSKYVKSQILMKNLQKGIFQDEPHTIY